jgi:C1A family cysteine protease
VLAPVSKLLSTSPAFGAVTDVLCRLPGRLFPGEPKTLYALAAQFKITSYFNLGRDLDNWKSWLANHGPVLTRVDVDRTWDNAKQTGGNLDEYLPATARGGHAVAFVGYTTDRFIVRNSWGLDWGHKGFGYASPQYAQAAFTEAYGVVS